MQGLNGIVSHSQRSVQKRAVLCEVFHLTEDTGARCLTQPQSIDTQDLGLNHFSPFEGVMMMRGERADICAHM